MDFITYLPKIEGNNVIMVVVDRLTNYFHLCSLSHWCHVERKIEQPTIGMRKVVDILENPLGIILKSP